MPPSTSSQTNKITEVETYNIHSVNKVLVQQILETIGQITKKTLDRNPQQIMKLRPMILKLYRQLMRWAISSFLMPLFNQIPVLKTYQ